MQNKLRVLFWPQLHFPKCTGSKSLLTSFLFFFFSNKHTKVDYEMYLCDSHSTISFTTSDGFCEDSICLSSIKPTGLHTAALYQRRTSQYFRIQWLSFNLFWGKNISAPQVNIIFWLWPSRTHKKYINYSALIYILIDWFLKTLHVKPQLASITAIINRLTCRIQKQAGGVYTKSSFFSFFFLCCLSVAWVWLPWKALYEITWCGSHIITTTRIYTHRGAVLK